MCRLSLQRAREMVVVQAGVESLPRASKNATSSAAAAATRTARVFVNMPWAKDHKTVTGLLFLGCLVACEPIGYIWCSLVYSSLSGAERVARVLV